ncbi:MAG: hypothetical protein ACRDLZ_05205 [Gaiellaceae bacterium]
MSKHRNSLLDLHPAAVAGSLLGAGPEQGPAPHDAEPETYEPRQSLFRRLLGSRRARRAPSARAETGRAST